MKQNTILLGAVSLVLLIIIIYNILGGGSASQEKNYTETIESERKENATFMRKNEESPFVKNDKEFTKLNYFPIESKYKVKASLRYLSPAEKISMKMSQGSDEIYLKYAYAKFRLLGKDCQVVLLKKRLNDPMLFLSFTDETSGRTSYGAGRYLDIPIAPGAKPNSIFIDFNKVYNPYCAYIESYACPKPPEENHLEIAIEAGEKVFENL